MFDLIVDADSFRFSAHAPHGELDSESCRDGNEAQVVRPDRRSRMLLGRGSKLRTFFSAIIFQRSCLWKNYTFFPSAARVGFATFNSWKASNPLIPTLICTVNRRRFSPKNNRARFSQVAETQR
jgi:hypothetical protein